MRALLLVPMLLAAPLLPLAPASAAPLPVSCAETWAAQGVGVCEGLLVVGGTTDSCILTGHQGLRLWTHFDGTIRVDGASFSVANADVLVAIPAPQQMFDVIGGDGAKNYCRIIGQGAVAIVAHPAAVDGAISSACDAAKGTGVADACEGVVVLWSTHATCPRSVGPFTIWSGYTGEIRVNGAPYASVTDATVVVGGVVEMVFCTSPGSGNGGERAVGAVLAA